MSGPVLRDLTQHATESPPSKRQKHSRSGPLPTGLKTVAVTPTAPTESPPKRQKHSRSGPLPTPTGQKTAPGSPEIGQLPTPTGQTTFAVTPTAPGTQEMSEHSTINLSDEDDDTAPGTQEMSERSTINPGTQEISVQSTNYLSEEDDVSKVVDINLSKEEDVCNAPVPVPPVILIPKIHVHVTTPADAPPDAPPVGERASTLSLLHNISNTDSVVFHSSTIAAPADAPADGERASTLSVAAQTYQILTRLSFSRRQKRHTFQEICRYLH